MSINPARYYFLKPAKDFLSTAYANLNIYIIHLIFIFAAQFYLFFLFSWMQFITIEQFGAFGLVFYWFYTTTKISDYISPASITTTENRLVRFISQAFGWYEKTFCTFLLFIILFPPIYLFDYESIGAGNIVSKIRYQYYMRSYLDNIGKDESIDYLISAFRVIPNRIEAQVLIAQCGQYSRNLTQDGRKIDLDFVRKICESNEIRASVERSLSWRDSDIDPSDETAVTDNPAIWLAVFSLNAGINLLESKQNYDYFINLARAHVKSTDDVAMLRLVDFCVKFDKTDGKGISFDSLDRLRTFIFKYHWNYLKQDTHLVQEALDKIGQGFTQEKKVFAASQIFYRELLFRIAAREYPVTWTREPIKLDLSLYFRTLDSMTIPTSGIVPYIDEAKSALMIRDFKTNISLNDYLTTLIVEDDELKAFKTLSGWNLETFLSDDWQGSKLKDTMEKMYLKRGWRD